MKNTMRMVGMAFVAAVTVSLANVAQAQINATFDWAEVSTGTAWWTGYGYEEVDNGVTMVSGGRAASWNNDAGLAFALKASYSQDAAPGTFDMQIGGISQLFTVLSIDISANDSSGEFTPSVQGVLSGVEQWSIVPTADSTFSTYTSATSGDIGLQIDQLVWNTGESSNPNATFNNNIDNLSVNVVPEPATFGLIGLGLAALLMIRRR